MRWALLLAGVGVFAAVGASWWFVRRAGKVKRVECAVRPADVLPVSPASPPSPASPSGTSPETELSDAEIDALPPELPAAPVRGRGRPAIPDVRV